MSAGCAIGACEHAPLEGKTLCRRHWGMTPAPLRVKLQVATIRRNRALWGIGEFLQARPIERILTRLELAQAEQEVRRWWNVESPR